MTGIEKLEGYEEELREKYGEPGESILTISGLPGQGTSTLARFLTDELGMELYNAGLYHRHKAEERGLSIEEFMRRIDEIQRKENVDFDLQLERKVLEMAHRKDGILFEARLSGVLLRDIAKVRIWVSCDQESAARRFARREEMSDKEGLKEMNERGQVEVERFKRIYGVDITDLDHYNVVVDNSGDLDETKENLMNKVKKKIDEKDVDL